MSTREFFEARYRRIAAEYGPQIAGSHYEFIHGYPQPRIHGRIRQPIPETVHRLIEPLLGSISLPSELENREEPEDPIPIKEFTLDQEIEEEEKTKFILPKIGLKENKDWDEIWERNNRALETSIDKWDRIWDRENAAYEREFDRKYKGLNYSIFPLKRRR
ncbi:MAG: hypothetical protein GTN36_00055 [Candidatus Aenigmarchaeota archaeon]|nr:hypothetical protein [Candidatus Aenigmarchaeota archaeon]